ncbi:hypothetical protein ACFR9U_05940 [Halorientalis brevis]|uniref:CARDB domain-containing protein n=1 Tax=Halorientalis brevis TaxID=1126241 RepID=A0ABD6C9J7_9EURY|nr:hypothetical protein [Halorientalis brevis]
MHRRQLLTLAGAGLVGLAGCLSDPGSGPPEEEPSDPTTTDSPTSSPTGSPTTSPDDPPSPDGVTVEDVVVRKAVTYESIMGSGGVLAAEGTQYVVATVRSDRNDLPSFTFETDDQSWESGLSDTVGAANFAVAGHEGGAVGRRLGGDGESFLAFEIPSPLSASNPRIRLGGSDPAEWPLSADATARLAAPAPRFELDELSVPDIVSEGDALSVTLTVRNVSDTDGRFLAAVYWPTARIADDDESHLVERQVAAGESATATLELSTEYTAAESGPVTLSVDGHVAAEREVTLQNVSTPA